MDKLEENITNLLKYRSIIDPEDFETKTNSLIEILRKRARYDLSDDLKLKYKNIIKKEFPDYSVVFIQFRRKETTPSNMYKYRLYINILNDGTIVRTCFGSYNIHKCRMKNISGDIQCGKCMDVYSKFRREYPDPNDLCNCSVKNPHLIPNITKCLITQKKQLFLFLSSLLDNAINYTEYPIENTEKAVLNFILSSKNSLHKDIIIMIAKKIWRSRYEKGTWWKKL